MNLYIFLKFINTIIMYSNFSRLWDQRWLYLCALESIKVMASVFISIKQKIALSLFNLQHGHLKASRIPKMHR
jgi:hypothetical protein